MSRNRHSTPKRAYYDYAKSRTEPDEVVDEESISENINSETNSVESVINGKVVGCLKLNVRESPSIDSNVVCEIASSTEVVIDEQKSTNDFYKIYISSGIEGFCMKQFIEVC